MPADPKPAASVADYHIERLADPLPPRHDVHVYASRPRDVFLPSRRGGHLMTFLLKVTLPVFALLLFGCLPQGIPRSDTNPAPTANTVDPGGAFQASVESPPASWAGPVFQLSHAYPTALPTAVDSYPWLAVDYEQNPSGYMDALLGYARQQLEPVDWQPAALPKPNWFHAPWMATGAESGKGREFIHGLTNERTSQPGELAPTQTSRFSNYAVGLYNDVGGYTFGEVWSDPTSPRSSSSVFHDGTMSIKLLFTTATIDQVPYLRGSKEWQANLYDAAKKHRVPQVVRLLQVDVAARDSRNKLTGWLFGTFFYDASHPGKDPLDRLVPVGLMWGNDPGVAPGGPITQQWINPVAAGTIPHLGWGGRLNGPVDNPMSSCLSCHATAQTPVISPMVAPQNSTTVQQLRWFRNIMAGQPFDSGADSLDYSLQMAVGVQNVQLSQPHLFNVTPPEFPVTRGD